jgi:hypothetical protein
MSLLEENAEILARMERDGTDLGPSRPVDFSHVFSDQRSAEAFANECSNNGFKIDIAETERDDEPWDVTVSKEMEPSAAISLRGRSVSMRALEHMGGEQTAGASFASDGRQPPHWGTLGFNQVDRAGPEIVPTSKAPATLPSRSTTKTYCTSVVYGSSNAK